MTQCNMAVQTMAHNDPRPKGILLEGEGVGPSAKGQQKRSVCKQFFFLQNFYFLLYDHGTRQHA
jgi:hypothetical protein